MKTIEVKQYTIAERKPTDSAVCWVHRTGVNSYGETLIYNEVEDVWDDVEGDDYAFDINDNDIYIELQNL